MQLSLRAGMVALAAVLAFALPPAIVWMRGSSSASPASASGRLRVADFGAEIPSIDARRLADWIASTRDNAGASFAIIDKKFARLHVFDGAARLKGSSAILIGAAIGDDSVPGIGLRPVADVRPEERTTPAGRFVVERGHNLRGEDVVWVSYADSVSMHPVLTEKPWERRLERLQTPSLDDKRISYGCINVPAAFYETSVLPAFAKPGALVYVLPEVKTLEQVFGVAGAVNS
jgi:hypothetical protein